MELRIYNELLEPQGVVEEMVTLIWNAKYFNVGTVKILAPATQNNIKLLEKGNIVVKRDAAADHTDGNGRAWRRAAQITYVSIKQDNRGQEQIEAQGYALSRWLSKRVVQPQVVTTGTRQHIINQLILRNCGEEAAETRRFPQFEIIPQDNYGGIVTDYHNEIYVDLGTEVKDVAQNGKLGYDILIDERDRLYGFWLYKGMDLTAENNDGNNPCIFAREFDNVTSQEYETSCENVKNYIIVVGKQLEGEAAAPTVTAADEVAGGLRLQETFYDASSIERTYKDDEGNEQEIPIETYYRQLESKAAQELSARRETMNFSSGINTKSTMKYREDYNIGDRVTCLDRKLGIRLDARITEITETYQNGKTEIDAIFGESEPTLIEKIRKVR